MKSSPICSAEGGRCGWFRKICCHQCFKVSFWLST